VVANTIPEAREKALAGKNGFADDLARRWFEYPFKANINATGTGDGAFPPLPVSRSPTVHLARDLPAFLFFIFDFSADLHFEVYYPGLPAHPGYRIHEKQSTGFGAMLSFRVPDAALAEKVINRCKLIIFAESLGGVETLITYPVRQTHGDIPAQIREKIGVTDDLLRLSVGIEHVEDLIEDLEQAMAA
jgi:hypothetical protein